MIVQPKVRGFICTASHPEGCFEAVKRQIAYVKSQKKMQGPKRVLVIGASTGYGLATRITTTFGAGAKTIGVFFERPASGKRTASAGWYNTAAFEKIAHAENFYAKSINGDAFSDEIKQQTAGLIKKDLGKVDLIVYSLASPRRTDPTDGKTYSSVLKPCKNKFTNKSVDPIRQIVKEISLEPATEEEIKNTTKVMGGEDWQMWIDYLSKHDLIAENAQTLAYTYIGPEITHDIYKEGTIGIAKKHLLKTADIINQKLSHLNGKAYLSVNKAIVTQASAAIPVVPLYMSILFKQMKLCGTHEGCIEQTYRIFRDKIFSESGLKLDADNLIRGDDWEMNVDIQQEVSKIWPDITTENLQEKTDIEGYCNDFYNLFGFGFDNIDYDKDTEINININSIEPQIEK